MPAYIQHIATRVPGTTKTQDFMMNLMLTHLGGDRRTDMILKRIYGLSGIGRRYTILSELEYADIGQGDTRPVPETLPTPEELKRLLVNPATGKLQSPLTGDRNFRYEEEARKLFVGATEQLFTERPDLDSSSITHVITVSCTGFYAPGPDIDIMNALGLPPTTQRFHIGFMSCFAGFSAMRMAKTICEAQPNARVLVVSVELCTLHLKFLDDINSILSNSVFGDGAAAVFVSNQKPANGHPALEFGQLGCTITPKGAEHMAWTVGNNGFDMVLSPEIPELIEEHLIYALQPLLDDAGINVEDLSRWGVHPGGRAIVDKVEKFMELPPEKVESSRTVLHDYGNMSSATIFFVLRDILKKSNGRPDGEHILAMTFGPGLSVEGGLLRLRF